MCDDAGVSRLLGNENANTAAQTEKKKRGAGSVYETGGDTHHCVCVCVWVLKLARRLVDRHTDIDVEVAVLVRFAAR